MDAAGIDGDTAAALREAIQAEADGFVRRISQATGQPFRWDVATTEAGTSYASFWAPDGSPDTVSWLLAPDESGQWDLTVSPQNAVVASAASAVLVLNRMNAS